MSITDELREYFGKSKGMFTDHVLAIADRIDAEHEKACDDAWDNGYEADYLGIESWLTEHPQVMEHHGWIRLPKDADEVPWNVGDCDEDCNTVIELRLTSSGWFVITDGELPYQPDPYRPERKRHYHAPTVEDVLREFFARYVTTKPKEEDDAIIAEYAAKLRLADGEDA